MRTSRTSAEIETIRMRRLRACTGSYGWASNNVMATTVYSPLAATRGNRTAHQKRPSLPKVSLEFAHVDAAVARRNLQQFAATVQLASHATPFQRSAYGDLEVHGDGAISGMGVQFCRKVVRQRYVHPAIAGVDEPTAVHLRTLARRQIHMPIAAVQINLVDHAIQRDVAVAGAGADAAAEVVYLDGAVTGVNARAAGSAIDIDVAVAGVEVERRLGRHLNLDAHTPVAPVDVESRLVRNVDVDFDFVAVLVFGNGHSVRPNRIFTGRDMRSDRAARAT